LPHLELRWASIGKSIEPQWLVRHDQRPSLTEAACCPINETQAASKGISPVLSPLCSDR
jgi:hypothetical protein